MYSYTVKASKIPNRHIKGWVPLRLGGKKHRYFCLPALKDARLKRAVYYWAPTNQYYIVDYWHGMSIHHVRRNVINQLEICWPNSQIRLTPIVIPDDAILHHSPPRGYSIALHGDVPRQLVFCE